MINTVFRRLVNSNSKKGQSQEILQAQDDTQSSKTVEKEWPHPLMPVKEYIPLENVTFEVEEEFYIPTRTHRAWANMNNSWIIKFDFSPFNNDLQIQIQSRSLTHMNEEMFRLVICNTIFHFLLYCQSKEPQLTHFTDIKLICDDEILRNILQGYLNVYTNTNKYSRSAGSRIIRSRRRKSPKSK
jgi:hypothetical protein